MIIAMFYYFVGAVLNIIFSLFSVISYVFPAGFQTALHNIFGQLIYAQGILPIYAIPGYSGLTSTMGIMDILGYAIIFMSGWYLVKFTLWIVSFLPFLGKANTLPKA